MRLDIDGGCAVCCSLDKHRGLYPGAPKSGQPERYRIRYARSAALWRADQSCNRQEGGGAAAAEAAKREWDAFCIAIVGPSGDLVYFEKLDNCQFASVTISQH